MRFMIFKRQSLWAVFLGVLAMLLACLGLFNGVSAAGLFFNNTVRKMPVHRVSGVTNEVALSFDAAWGTDKTESILESLKKADVKATFFLVGFWAEEHEDLVRKIDEAGMEIGLHSNSHPDFCKLTKTQMENEIIENIRILEKITGKKPKFFRFPFGCFTDAAIEVCEKLSVIPVQWDVDSYDSRGLKATNIIERVLTRVKGGSIVLMHMGSEHIDRVVPVLVDSLKLKGFKPCTVGSMVMTENYIIDRQGEQKSKI